MMMKKPINGIVLVNKPLNLSSNAVLQRVKRLFHAKKAGHTGSLDPLATGMLPICLGEATKLSQYLLDADKCYEVTGLLGIKTSTGDVEGEVIATTNQINVTVDQLKRALTHFTGEIQQVPPMYSALKHQGKPLYKLARAGIDIERQARKVVIHALEFIDFDGSSFSLRVVCSKGTYIRSLVEDIGDYLQVGAHVTQLHRCYTAGFESESMVTLDELALQDEKQLAQHYLLPIDRAVNYLPILQLTADQVLMLYQGRTIPEIESDLIGLVRLYEGSETFIGLGDVDELKTLKVRRLVSFEPLS